MGISLRDNKGQGIVEYILVLVISVTIILGGLYQLNSAFKIWATNYFGNYLACLLETGELPTISGNGGDSGTCNQFFKPFTLAEGRQLIPQGNSSGGGGGGNDGGGTREKAGGRGGGGGGGGSSGGRVGTFNANNKSGGNAGGAGKGKSNKSDSTYTGNTSAANYGGGYSYGRGRNGSGQRTRLDTKFAFDDSRERQTRRSVASNTNKPLATGGTIEARTALKSGSKKIRGTAEGDDSGFSFADLLRYLIIAGILIAIFIFLGGQGLQIGKSME